MKVAFFDCFAGASGDMILGALVDALPDGLGALQRELSKLPLAGYTLTTKRETRGPISGTKVYVQVEGPLDPGGESHRRLKDIEEIIEASSLPAAVKAKAESIFGRLAQAEGKVHGIPPEAVHFHEVGAVDAIVDIVGAVAGLHLLGVEAVYSSPLPAGEGVVASSHGLFPVPAPATLELIAMAGAPLRPTPQVAGGGLGEMVTPTAAAILTTLATFRQPELRLQTVGYGLGSRDHPSLPNVLRLWIGEEAALRAEPQDEAKFPQQEVLLLETNIDDMNPEIYGYVMERILAQGAYDVWFTPIQMKKNRPATMLSVLLPKENEAEVVETILRETSTLGVRVRGVKRHLGEREVMSFQSSLGEVSVKVKKMDGRPFGVAPEYEDCRRLALEHGLPLREVYRRVEEEARRKLLPP